jgi:hypothetical protein
VTFILVLNVLLPCHGSNPTANFIADSLIHLLTHSLTHSHVALGQYPYEYKFCIMPGKADDVLVGVLSHVMIRHTKDETVELPKVIRMPPRCLKMSLPEETSYNAIVSTVRTNLVMTDM